MPGLPSLAPGTVFQRDFQVLGLLAEGGMGAVYAVEQLSTGKRRALKIMLPALVEDRKARERFAMEARIGAQIDSEHVVEVVAAGIDEPTQTPWLAMEMLEGQDLSNLLKQRGRLGTEEAIEILQQLGEGLGAAHAKGIVHRDLKPENLFIAVSRRRGVPFTLKILDFGIAKLTQENRATASATAALGSPMWMAPEQTEQGSQLRPATDVWAIGLIAFYLLTGRYYWRVANEPEVRLTALFTEVLVTPLDPPSVRAAQAGLAHLVPPGFDVWFSRCVARAPEQRFPSASAAIAAIGPGFTFRDPSGAVSVPQTLEGSRRLVAPTMPMQAVSREQVSPAYQSQRPPPMGYTPMSAPPPAAAPAPSPYVTSTPYAVQAASTSTQSVARPSSGVGRWIALGAGLVMLLVGGGAATFGGLILYERFGAHGGGATTATDPPPAVLDAGVSVAAPDAWVPTGLDPVATTDTTETTDTTDDGSDTSDDGTDGTETGDGTDGTETASADTTHHTHRPRPHDTADDGAGGDSTEPFADPSTDSSAGAGYAWADGTTLPFNGTYVQGDFRYEMTFTLVRSGGSVTGSIFVVCAGAPPEAGSIVGRSALEAVSGTYASSGALVLHGSRSTDTSVWEPGTYRITISSSGSVRGSGSDGARITGHT